MTTATDAFRNARDFLLAHREDYATAYDGFVWPRPEHFNWALDWFDVIAAGNDRTALHIVEEDGRETRLSFAELSERSDRIANWLRARGVGAEDRILVMLGNQAELWEVMLAAMKLRAVVIPATPLLGPADLRDRVERGRVRHVLVRAEDTAKFAEVPGTYTRIAVGGAPERDWLAYEDAYEAPAGFTADGPTLSDDPLMLYFTSGTTAYPKLVRHTQVSYPIGHLSTMYWLGVRPGDVHLNISSPGWGKHAWSNFFAPFLAQATVFIVNYDRFDAIELLEIMDAHQVSSFCAPPTVWRMLIQADLTRLTRPPREVVGAGEALNPEVINKVRAAWNNTIRDGFGQTEMTCCIGNSPGQPVKAGAMGRPMPGYTIALLDPVTEQPIEGPGEGEICLDLSADNGGLMGGYYEAPDLTAQACRGGFYHTGDIAERDAAGYLTYVGRADDVFKASDYKISPFELESALMLHDAVAECAVVPSPDPVRGAVPKAFIVLSARAAADDATAAAVFAHCREHLNGYQLVRIIEFTDELPKTVSSKIRRVELRDAEAARVASGDVTGQFLYARYRNRG